MKKLLLMLGCALLCASFAACSDDEPENPPQEQTEQSNDKEGVSDQEEEGDRWISSPPHEVGYTLLMPDTTLNGEAHELIAEIVQLRPEWNVAPLKDFIFYGAWDYVAEMGSCPWVSTKEWEKWFDVNIETMGGKPYAVIYIQPNDAGKLRGVRFTVRGDALNDKTWYQTQSVIIMQKPL